MKKLTREKLPKGLRKLRRLFIPTQALLLVFSIVLCFYGNQRISLGYEAELRQRIDRLVSDLNAYPDQFTRIHRLLLFDDEVCGSHDNQQYSKLARLQSTLRVYAAACSGLSGIWYHYSGDEFWYSGNDSNESLRYAQRFSLGSDSDEMYELLDSLPAFCLLSRSDAYTASPCFLFIYRQQNADFSAVQTAVFQLERWALERLLRDVLSDDIFAASLLGEDDSVLLSVGNTPAGRAQIMFRKLFIPNIRLCVSVRPALSYSMPVRLLLAAALVLLNLLLALFIKLLSSRYYMPMKVLRQMAADFTKQDDNDSLDDYEYLESSLEIVCLQHQRLLTEMQTQKNAAEDYVLYSLLSGHISDLEDFKRKVSSLNIHIPQDHLRVVVLLPGDERSRVNLRLAYPPFREALSDVAVACTLRYDVPCCIAVVSYSPAQEEELHRLLNGCLSASSLRLFLGISESGSDLKRMPLQCAQAFYSCALRQNAPVYYAHPQGEAPSLKQLQEELSALDSLNEPLSPEAALALLQRFLLYFSTPDLTLTALDTPETFSKVNGNGEALKAELNRLLKAFCEAENRSDEGWLEPIDEMKRYIQEQFDNPMFSLQTMAEHFSMSTSSLSGYFKKQSGSLLTDYVTELRIGKAKRLLRESDLSVQAVSVAVGYCSCTSFIRRFRLITGSTPGEYRLAKTR